MVGKGLVKLENVFINKGESRETLAAFRVLL